MDVNFAPLGKISLRQLRAFVAVASLGSFTSAARALNLTQSAVSILVSELERELELRLFDRTSRSVTLTEAGRDLLSPANRALADIRSAILRSRELSRKERGKVRVAATPLFSSLFLPPFILEFQREFPAIEIVIKDTAMRLFKAMILEGDVDIGIAAPPPAAMREEASLLTAETLYLDEIVLVCAPDHPLAQLPRVQWSDLKKFNYIAVTRESGTREIVEAAMNRANALQTPRYEVSSIWTLLGMVSAGLGYALTTAACRRLTSLYSIVIRRVGEARLDRPVVILQPNRRSLAPAATVFVQRLQTWMSDPDNH